MANFVLHYRVARRDLASAHAAIGAMLPDLWRMADRAMRPARAAVTSDDARVREVLAGIEHHEALDASFHRSPLFIDGETATRAAFDDCEAPRIRLFAHVAWELLVDGALVRREGAALLAAMAADVDEASRAGAVHAASRAHLAARAREVPSLFEPRLTRMLDAIAAGDFVAGYRDARTVAERLDTIRQRVGLDPFAAAQRDRVARALASLEPLADRLLRESREGAPSR